MAEQTAEHFQDLSRQAHAARLGMWIFLGTEVLFFAGLFALYAAYRTEHPRGFGIGVERNTVFWGSANTAVLLVSSYTVALAVHELRRGRRRACALLVGATMLLGLSLSRSRRASTAFTSEKGSIPAGWGPSTGSTATRGRRCSSPCTSA